MIHPDLTNLTMLRAMRDEALERSEQAPGTELKLAFRMLSSAAGYLASALEREDLRLRLEESREQIGQLQETITALRVELIKCMDKPDVA